MDPFATSHLSHRALYLDLKTSRATECRSTAVVLSRIAEYDLRQLYLAEGYSSMHAFCVRDLNYSDGAAYKRITAARLARRFPVIFVEVAEGRLHLSGVVMLSRYLTAGNLDELLAAASRKTKAQIEQLIADRFPRPDLPERLQAFAPPAMVPMPAPAQGSQLSPGTAGAGTPSSSQPFPMPGGQLSPGTVAGPVAPGRIAPLGAQRFVFQCTVDQETQELWQYARALMSHEVPAGNMAVVLKHLLKLAVGQLEKRKFAATARPGHSAGGNSPRHIPTAVKRAVFERDGAKCTFVGENGQRCPSRTFLEYDHAIPVARGGQATVENVRILCRSHNRFEASRVFGAEFVARKLEERGAQRRE